jgi:maltooligosyltrehalose synthase
VQICQGDREGVSCSTECWSVTPSVDVSAECDATVHAQALLAQTCPPVPYQVSDDSADAVVDPDRARRLDCYAVSTVNLSRAARLAEALRVAIFSLDSGQEAIESQRGPF